MKLTILCGWLVNGCELVHERSYVAAIFQQCFINYSLRECRLKFLAPPRTSVYTQNHTCRTKYRKPHMVWGSLRLWWPLTFAIWQVFQEAYVTLETLALGSAMGADGSHVACYLRGLGIFIQGVKVPRFPLITAPVWHISRIIFWVEGFRCQCHVTKTFLKKGIRPNNFFDTGLLVRNRCGCGFFGSGHYQIDWRGSQWPHWSVEKNCPRPVDGNHLVDIGRTGF